MERAICDICNQYFTGVGAVYSLLMHKQIVHGPAQTPSQLAEPKTPWKLTENDVKFLRCNKIDPEQESS